MRLHWLYPVTMNAIFSVFSHRRVCSTVPRSVFSNTAVCRANTAFALTRAANTTVRSSRPLACWKSLCLYVRLAFPGRLQSRYATDDCLLLLYCAAVLNRAV